MYLNKNIYTMDPKNPKISNPAEERMIVLRESVGESDGQTSIVRAATREQFRKAYARSSAGRQMVITEQGTVQ